MHDYEVVGYTEDGEVYCSDCGHETDDPIFAGNEDLDSLNCGQCGCSLSEW
jgi:hypothetical protein